MEWNEKLIATHSIMMESREMRNNFKIFLMKKGETYPF